MSSIQKFRTWLRRPNKSKLEQWIETLIVIVPIAFVIRTFVYGLYQVPTGSMETTMLVGERFFADKFTPIFQPITHGDIITFNDPNFDYSDNPLMNLFQRYVWGPSNWTKRVIGIPGDHIEGKMENGRPVIYRNGEKLDEPYINKYPLVATFKDGSRTSFSFKSFDPNYSFENQPYYKMNKYDVDLARKVLMRMGQEWIKEPGTPAYDSYNRNADEYNIHLGSNEYWALGDNRLGSYDSRFWGATGRPLDGKLIHGKIVLRLWSIDSGDSWWIWDLIKHPISFWKRVRWDRFFQIVR